ncbi:hypothetical protein INT46_009845, partial [Mucor plumbeus]
MVNFTFWIYSTITVLAFTIIVAASDSEDDSRGTVNGEFMSHKMIVSPVKDTMNDHRIAKRLNILHLSVEVPTAATEAHLNSHSAKTGELTDLSR